MRLLCLLTTMLSHSTPCYPGCGQPVFRIGGEIRERFEYLRNPSMGLDRPDEDGVLLQRFMLHADVHLGSRVRLFGELKSGISNGSKYGPQPPDVDRLDVHQAFLEAGSAARRLVLRAGRQEVSLGSGRLVSIREGPNVRQSFDGARLTILESATKDGWTADVLALRPVETNIGIFDDSPNHRHSLWGVYATRPGVDLYYLGNDRRDREQRHSVGIRAWRALTKSRWDYDYEGVWQFGRASASDNRIRAWTAASNTGYTWRERRFKPRIGLKADVASGDRNPTDRITGTFNALFPKGAYFNQAGLLGPYNIIDLHPSLTIHLAKNVTITPDVDFFWRYSSHDGIYDVPGNLVLASSRGGSNSRYIGVQTNIAAEWRPDLRHWSIEAHYLRFYPGAFLKGGESGMTRRLDFIAVWTTFRF